MLRAGLIPLALLTAGCAAQPLDPITVVGQVCDKYLTTIVESGACDHVERLDDCEPFIRAMRDCEKLLDAAKRVR